MSKEYVFWLKFITKSCFYQDFFWIMPKELIKVVITENEIRFSGSVGHNNSQGNFSITLSNVAEITWSISAPGVIGIIKIITQDLEYFYLKPVNPLDPTLTLIATNWDELIAFCNVVNAFKNNQTPDYEENPYIRQLQTEDKPSYLRNVDIQWNKNVSPWEYYYKFVPASVEKKRRITVKIWKYLVLSGVTIAVLGSLYALFLNFRW
jgi:hypothetical protein